MLASNEIPLATKLIDFGLVHVHGGGAKASTDPSDDGDTHMLGTPLFASPEQLREEAIDARADLFSLGMTLWFLAIGQAPETGSLSDITSSRLSAESYRGRLPDNLADPIRSGIERLIEKDPAQRFASATEFLQSLGHETKATVAPRTEPAKAAEPKVDPLAVETINATLSSEWKTGSRQSETFTGNQLSGDIGTRRKSTSVAARAQRRPAQECGFTLAAASQRRAFRFTSSFRIVFAGRRARLLRFHRASFWRNPIALRCSNPSRRNPPGCWPRCSQSSKKSLIRATRPPRFFCPA